MHLFSIEKTMNENILLCFFWNKLAFKKKDTHVLSVFSFLEHILTLSKVTIDASCCRITAWILTPWKILFTYCIVLSSFCTKTLPPSLIWTVPLMIYLGSITKILFQVFIPMLMVCSVPQSSPSLKCCHLRITHG